MPEIVGTSLIVLMAGRRVGVLTQTDNGRLALEYDEDWRSSRNATPLSLQRLNCQV